MGCNSSKAFEADKEIVLSTQFGNTNPLSWNVTIPGNTFTVVANKAHKLEAGVVQDQSGNVLLEVRQARNAKTVSFHEPGTGKTVLLVCKVKQGNYITRKEARWSLYTDENISGGEKEVTETGASMYRFGTFKTIPKGYVTEPIQYFYGTSSVPTMTSKFRNMAGTKATVWASDGVTPGAVVENMKFPYYLNGTCTFAQGVDPLISFVMATTFLSMNDNA